MKRLLSFAAIIAVISAGVYLWHSNNLENTTLQTTSEEACCEHEDHGPRRHGHDHSHKEGIITSAFTETTEEQDEEQLSTTGWTGRCVDIDQQPLAGVIVSFHPPLSTGDTFHSSPWGMELPSALTDEEGNYTVQLNESHLKAAMPEIVTQTCEFRSPDNSKVLFFSEQTPLTLGNIDELPVRVLGSHGASVVGSVMMDNGLPLSGAEVRIVFTTGAVADVILTSDEHGRFESAGLRCFGETQPTSYRAYITNASLLFPGKNVEISPHQADVHIDGGRADFIVTAKEPEPRVQVVAMENLEAMKQVRFLVLDEQRTIVQGIPVDLDIIAGPLRFPFDMEASKAGSAKLVAELWSKLEPTKFARANLRVEEQGNSTFLSAGTVRWQQGVQIRGQVVDKNGNVLASETVVLLPNNRSRFGGLHYREALTDKDGNFSLPAVPGGQSYLLAIRGPSGFGDPISVEAGTYQFHDLGTLVH